MSGLEEPIGEAFFLPDELGPPGCDMDPRAIAAELVATEPDHADLKQGEANILFLMRSETKLNQTKMELGSLQLPVFSGRTGALATWLMVRAFGALPDFIMILDAQFWRQAPREQRIALVDHELMHGCVAVNKEGEQRFADDGRPVWAIRPHDLEEFDSIVARHGAWSPDITRFLTAAGTRRTY